jgi:signal transduction histidine kinase
LKTDLLAQVAHELRQPLSAMSAGTRARRELQLRKSKFDLCQIIDDSVDVVASDVAANGLDLSSTLPPGSLYVTADQTRVRQILSNLLTNAVKFTPTGRKVALQPRQLFRRALRLSLCL